MDVPASSLRAVGKTAFSSPWLTRGMEEAGNRGRRQQEEGPFCTSDQVAVKQLRSLLPESQSLTLKNHTKIMAVPLHKGLVWMKRIPFVYRVKLTRKCNLPTGIFFT